MGKKPAPSEDVAEIVIRPTRFDDLIAVVTAESSQHASRLMLVNEIADRMEKLIPSREELDKFAAGLRAAAQELSDAIAAG
jgi:tRNA splicing ligase